MRIFVRIINTTPQTIRISSTISPLRIFESYADKMEYYMQIDKSIFNHVTHVPRVVFTSQ